MNTPYLLMLAREYLDCIAEAKSTAYNERERNYWNAQRSIVHNDLIRLLGDAYARPFDMVAHCRELLAAPASARRDGLE
jgi:hypothetical protein